MARADMQELGTTGLKRTSGFVVDEFLVKLRGIQGVKTYREMADNDPVIGAFLYAVEKIITRIDWRVDPFKDSSSDGEPNTKDIETAVFVESCLNDMSDSWDSTLSQIMSMVTYGWSWHEIVYKQRLGPDQKDPTKRSKFDDGKIGWRKWPIRGQETLWSWGFTPDGGIECMYQIDPWTGRGRVEIPIEKSLLFRTTAQKGNPEGRSLLRNAYRPWWYKRRIEEIEAIGIERDLAGLPVANVPPEYLSIHATAEQQSVLAAIKQIVTSIKRNEQEGIIFPQIYDDGGHKLFELVLLSSGGSRQFDTDRVITRYDQRIAMSVLSDFLLLGHDRVGSFSLGSTKMDLFTMSVDSIAKTIADTINTHAIPRLLRLNGIDTKRVPRITYSDVANVDIGAVSAFVSQMAQAGVLAPDPGLEDYIRDLAGLPPANHGVEDTGTGLLSPEDAKTVLFLPPEQRIVATRTGVKPDAPAPPGGEAPPDAPGEGVPPDAPGEGVPPDAPAPPGGAAPPDATGEGVPLENAGTEVPTTTEAKEAAPDRKAEKTPKTVEQTSPPEDEGQRNEEKTPPPKAVKAPVKKRGR